MLDLKAADIDLSIRYCSQACDHAYWLVMAEKFPRRSVMRIADWIEAEARPPAAPL